MDMNIIFLWRKDHEEPEALQMWNEYELECNQEGFDQAVDKAKENGEVRIIKFELDWDAVKDSFEPTDLGVLTRKPEATDSSFDHRNPCFTLAIKDPGTQMVNLVKVTRGTFGIPLRDAKELVEVTDTLLAVGPFDKIAELKRALENCGSEGVVIETNTTSWDKYPAMTNHKTCYTLHYGGEF